MRPFEKYYTLHVELKPGTLDSNRYWGACLGALLLAVPLQRCCLALATLLPGPAMLLPGPATLLLGHATLLPGLAMLLPGLAMGP